MSRDTEAVASTGGLKTRDKGGLVAGSWRNWVENLSTNWRHSFHIPPREERTHRSSPDPA